MGALARFSDSLEEVEPFYPHPRGHGDVSTDAGRPFLWLSSCGLLADPPGSAGKQQLSSQEGAPPCLAYLVVDMCTQKSSALQITVPPNLPHLHPSRWDVLVSSNPYYTL